MTYDAIALAVTATVLNGLWEGLLIAAIVWAALRAFPRLAAASRHAIWLAALGAVLLTPLVTTVLAAGPPATADEAQSANAATVLASRAAQVFVEAPRPAAPPAEASATQADPSSSARLHRAPVIPVPERLTAVVALAWLLAAGWRAGLLLANLRELASIRSTARPWDTRDGFPVLISGGIALPLATGFRHPAIALPSALVAQLSEDALEAVIVHEAAHLRRNDVWTNAFARMAEALLILNPAAWFIMRRIAREREIACDDWVVTRTGRGTAFAQTLLDLAGSIGTPAPIGAPSAIGYRHAIVERIERLLDSRPRTVRPSLPALGGSSMLLAIVALVVQSISPVLAYAAPIAHAPQNIAVAACANPDSGIRRLTFLGMIRIVNGKPARTGSMGLAMPKPAEVVALAGADNVATFDLTVDATGRARNVQVISAPQYPGMAAHVSRVMMSEKYEPALHDCVPVNSTVRTAAYFGTPKAQAYSIVSPAYPQGWSAQHVASCKVPVLQHGGVPAVPAGSENIPVDTTYVGTVRVHLNPSGSPAATIVKSTGQRALDDALLASARSATYPLTEDTGFKQVRPSKAFLAWNASHGAATYINCSPLPTDYVWNTTFSRVVPIGVPGSKRIVVGPS